MIIIWRRIRGRGCLNEWVILGDVLGEGVNGCGCWLEVCQGEGVFEWVWLLIGDGSGGRCE